MAELRWSVSKSRNKEEPLNYRVIQFVKYMNVVKKQWIKFLEHGIVTDKLWLQTRTFMCNKLIALILESDAQQERDGWVACIYLDLKEAVNKAPLTRLLWKLESRGGLKEKMINWMKLLNP